MIGDTVGHYKVQKKIGEGGMGVVYRAEDSKLKRTVALKFLQPHLFTDAVGKARFIHEAQAAAALDHPNICTIYEIDEAQNHTFISMAHIEGESLRERMQMRPLELREVLDIGIQVAEGLQAAHDRSIVHRDIKSANIMVTAAGQVKITDFGIAKLAGRTKVTRTGATVGTVDYMSPEQTSGESVDHRTDIWSIGVLLYEMVSGQLPFRADVDHAVVYKILNEDQMPMTGLVADLPTELERIIGKTLKKRVEERYQQAAELAAELKALRNTLYARMTKAGASPASPQLSVAVLPFANMSADEEQEYFCDGMAEDIINDLTNVEGLRVASRTSSFTFKGKSQDIIEIGKKLRVKTLLEGSVRKAGNRIRITAQLINVEDGFHIWSQRYDRELKDVFAVQDEISQNIVQALKVKLTPREKKAMEKMFTKDAHAYDLYLRGRELFLQWQRTSINEALDVFTEAIARDPNYALAHAGLANCYCVLYTDHDRKMEHIEKAYQASQKALDLDAELAEAHVANGYALTCLRKEYPQAEDHFETATKLNPKLFEAYYFYARCCVLQEKMEKAAQLYEQACLMKPEDYQARVFLAQTYKSLKLQAGAEAAYQRAVENVERHIELHPDDSRGYQLGALALIEIGEREKGLDWAHRAVSMDPHSSVLLYNVSCFFSLAGEHEDAVGYLRKAFEGLGDDATITKWARTDPDLDPIRSDPRFKTILEGSSVE
jgi:non-specific serine/threonine protein kinase